MKEENVNYFENVTGFYVEPSETGDYPGMVMIHEWWGLSDNIKNKAQELAGEGYTLDLFQKSPHSSKM
jgi:carboxymethylenebutenolidase